MPISLDKFLVVLYFHQMDISQYSLIISDITGQSPALPKEMRILPKQGTGLRSNNQSDLLEYGYSGTFRNYFDITGVVVLLENYPENVFFLRQSLEKRELLPFVVPSYKQRPKHADFVSIAGGVYGFSDQGSGSSLAMPVAQYIGPPSPNKAALPKPSFFLNEQERIDSIQQVLKKRSGDWNYVNLAGVVIRRELSVDALSKQPMLCITLAQHASPKTHINLIYSNRDAGVMKANCQINSFISVRAIYGSRMIADQIVPTFWIKNIRGLSLHDTQFTLKQDASRVPAWVKGIMDVQK